MKKELPLKSWGDKPDLASHLTLNLTGLVRGLRAGFFSLILGQK